MQTKELDSTRSFCAWRAVQDVRMRNAVNSSRYSDMAKLRAERMKMALELVYAAAGVYINYRKNKIAVKVNDCMVRDRSALRCLEQDWAAAGVVKSLTRQGVIYSFA